MCDFQESSQLHQWIFSPPSMLEKCRAKGNQLAREHLAAPTPETTGSTPPPPPVETFACGYAKKQKETPDDEDPNTMGPQKNSSDHPFLTPDEEELLVTFYASKLPLLIGPTAQFRQLIRNDSKVVATAAAFLRRFFMSNSVMIHDPKTIMVAAAFLAMKVEDCMAHVKSFEIGTDMMSAPVTQAEILSSELSLLDGIRFQLLCFHPYKPVVALTEDLRSFLKSEKGKSLVQNKRIAGEDLIPIYDAARAVLDDVIVSDIPLLYTPGQIGLAAMIVANEQFQLKQQKKRQEAPDGEPKEEGGLLSLDLMAYVRLRFSEERGKQTEAIMQTLVPMIKGLKEGKHGCGNHGVDMVKLKGIHKKLKKCRGWGKKEKKSKKRGADGGDEPKSKKAKAQ